MYTYVQVCEYLTIKIAQNHQNRSESFRIAQNRSDLLRIVQNRSEVVICTTIWLNYDKSVVYIGK